MFTFYTENIAHYNFLSSQKTTYNVNHSGYQ